MIVRRFCDPKLAQASYLIGCARTGSAVVIDPSRDVEQYVRVAGEEGVAITHVTETHIHADCVTKELGRASRPADLMSARASGGASGSPPRAGRT